jgi:single-strand DNA-binding protein
MSVAGVVANEPRIVDLDDSRRITSFRLASTSRRKDATTNAWVDGPTLWVTVTCWRELAFNASESIHKRDRVVAYGRVRTRDWNQDGVTRTTFEMDAESLGHDLAFGTSSFQRKIRGMVVQRPGQPEADDLATAVALESVDGAAAEPAGADGRELPAEPPDEFDEELAAMEAEERGEREESFATARA